MDRWVGNFALRRDVPVWTNTRLIVSTLVESDLRMPKEMCRLIASFIQRRTRVRVAAVDTRVSLWTCLSCFARQIGTVGDIFFQVSVDDYPVNGYVCGSCNVGDSIRRSLDNGLVGAMYLDPKDSRFYMWPVIFTRPISTPLVCVVLAVRSRRSVIHIEYVHAVRLVRKYDKRSRSADNIGHECNDPETRRMLVESAIDIILARPLETYQLSDVGWQTPTEIVVVPRLKTRFLSQLKP